MLNTSTRFNPGPGAYEPRDTINKSGQYAMSHMSNTLSPSFTNPSFGKGRNGEANSSKSFLPGPGAYSPKIDITSPKVLPSVYKSSLVKTFYHNDRFPTSNLHSARKLPGPG